MTSFFIPRVKDWIPNIVQRDHPGQKQRDKPLQGVLMELYGHRLKVFGRRVFILRQKGNKCIRWWIRLFVVLRKQTKNEVIAESLMENTLIIIIGHESREKDLPVWWNSGSRGSKILIAGLK